MSLDKTLLFLLLTFPLGGLYAQSTDSDLNVLIAKAVEISPKIKMLEAKQRAVENKIPQQTNLPDPMLTLGLMNLPTTSFSFSEEPMTGKTIGLSQGIPFPGKLGAVEKVLSKDVEIVQKEIDDAENEITRDVKQSYYDVLFIRKKIKLVEESKKLLENISEVVRTKYSVSSASQQNLIKVDLEITNVNDVLFDLKRKEAEQIEKLNSLILDNSEKYIFTDELPDLFFIDFTLSQLDSIAEANRPYLLGLESAESKAVEQQNLAEYDYYPNFNLAVQYTQRDKIAQSNTPLNDFFSLMLGVSIPLNYGGKVSAKVEEAASMKELYEAQYSMAMQMLRSSFGASIAKLRSIEQRIQLTEEGLIPQARQNFTSALSSYQVGKIDFINVIDAQKNLFDVEIKLYDLKTEYLKEVAALEFLVGTTLIDKSKFNN
ncbi:MAG: hypothetical protein A2V66_02360 [Ignavibacteria bacterium RBG_13_36_8]|nr:MAG: hypothetical protein A2V66_02360 [Ignavibacteria bacterium RBG_13_36_8]